MWLDCVRRRRRVHWKCERILWWRLTVANRSSGRKPICRSKSSGRLWMCCGFACHASRTIRRRPWDALTPAVSLSSINRGNYWQCGYVIPKGQFDEIRRQGLDSFHEKVVQLAPYAKDQVSELKSWDDIKLLTVRVDRLSQWFRPGLLCIGDAAHAMSPVGGVGINLAIQDAVAAANALAEPLRERRLTIAELRRIQKRREFPTRVTQGLQVAMQRRVIAPVLGGGETGETTAVAPTDRRRSLASAHSRLYHRHRRPPGAHKSTRNSRDAG